MGDITDNIMLGERDIIMQESAGMILCASASLAVSLLAGFVLANISASVGRNMRLAQFDSVQAFSPQDMDRFSAASLITRSTNDVTQVQNFVARGLQASIKCPIIVIWALSRISSSSAEWTGMTLVGVLVLVTVMLFSVHCAAARYREVQWLTDGINRSVRENLNGIRTIRAYNAEGFRSADFERLSDSLMDNNISAARIMAPAFPISQSMMNFVVLGIYWVGAGIVASASQQDGQLLKYSEMIVLTSYATMVLGAVMQSFGVLRMLPRAMAGYRRIEEVVNARPSIEDGSMEEGFETGTLEFRNVSFIYPGSDRKALDDVSFNVRRGEFFAVVGPTGSGKSALIDLVNRFYDPSSGCVLVDGVDIRGFKQSALREKIGYVPQEAVVFSGTIEENVNYGSGRDGRGAEDVSRALHAACADGFVSEMQGGTDSRISQHGRNLSGGQKQRISIARAVCKDPEIYLLDDAFSALDYRTEKKLRRTLRREASGSTFLIVSQRINAVRDADEIIVLDRGRIVGRGKHADLLRSCGPYREMAASQSAEEELP